MWKLYIKSNEGIAIQSTTNGLKTCILDKSFNVFIGQVEYLDYQLGIVPMPEDISPFLYKRKSFEHEREIRAIIQEFRYNKDGSINYKKTRFDDGAYIPVDVNVLIDNVYLAPTSQKWVFKLVDSVLKKYGIRKKIQQSELEDIPVF
jgi:hypothetical protein